ARQRELNPRRPAARNTAFRRANAWQETTRECNERGGRQGVHRSTQDVGDAVAAARAVLSRRRGRRHGRGDHGLPRALDPSGVGRLASELRRGDERRAFRPRAGRANRRARPDRFGRKTVLMASVLLFGLFTVGTAYTHTLTEMAVLRLLTGLGLGAA